MKKCEDSRTLSDKTLVVVLGVIGPYHAARLSALNDKIKCVGGDLIVVQRVGFTAEYPWYGRESDLPFRVVNAYSDSDPSPGSSKSAWQLARILRELQPDFVALGLSSVAYLGAVAWGITSRCRLLLMTESKADDAQRTPAKEWLKRHIYCRFSAALVGGAPHVDYAVSLGLPRHCCFYGHNAVDNQHFTELADAARDNSASLRASHGLPENYFVVAKRFVQKKNIVQLLQAYAFYRREMGTKAWDMVLMGDGPQQEEIRRENLRLGLNGAVVLPGLVDYRELPTYYGLGHALVHASVVEQWGLVVNEAMASGLPILVSNKCGAASMLLQEGVNGFTFDPTSVEQMTSTMVAFHRLSKEARQQMGAASRAIVAQWGVQRFAEGMIQAMQSSL